MDQSAMPHAMPAHAVASSDASNTAKLDRVFGTASLVMFGLAYLVPLTVFTTFGAVTRITEGHLPLAYAVTTTAMLFTAFSYATLVRVLPLAGSAFAYSTRAFGTRFGFVTGWTLLLDYILLPAINYLLIGIYLHAQLDSVPVAIWILSATVIVSALNIIGVDIVKRASVVLVVAQLVFAAIFVAAALRHDEVTLRIAPLYEPGLDWSQVVAGAAILCLSFLGFDAVSTLSEEAKDPRRTVPRAIMLTTIVGGGIFVLLSYAGTVLLPNWRSIVSADSAGLEVMQPLGPTISILFISAFLAGCIASAVASQASVSRILFAMGRDSVLPRPWFGHLSGRFHTPTYSILTVAAMSLVVLFISLETLASLISFGALFAFSVVNLSVMRLFLPQVERLTLPVILRYGVSPLIGLLLTVWLWFHLSPLALTVGFGWLGAGLAYSFIGRGKSKPDMAGA
jgi:amino acid transporter